MPAVVKQRKDIKKYLDQQGIKLDLFNGGGTSNVKTCATEDSLTEVTVGSGFLQSSLFDYFKDNFLECAFVFSLPITRRPSKNLICCQSGGFIASGETSKDKNPVPFLPRGLKEFPSEGYGEVQTPFTVPSEIHLDIGSAIFLRPAKSGEIAERFNTYLLKLGNKIVAEVETYRGFGKTFF